MHATRLQGERLDAWVAKAAGLQRQTLVPQPGERYDADGPSWHPDTFHPSVDWTHAARFLMDDWYNLEDCIANWFGPDWSLVPAFKAEPLAWFMRAFVATHFGEVLEDSAPAL
ncbi:hypothetical protein DIC66_08345 [Rhodoferax lacus]|uniref:Uncharacterized protein n=1 Tax=Rhodoferax lacus TaxID=2184758 RepID=A0A3E1RCQ3_9BURK|nr:hypothetical protein [Rhodoferax lacus]RFO97144.1 hypothetical protein DIC66_08345 [Rhodoferax lacus]